MMDLFDLRPTVRQRLPVAWAPRGDAWRDEVGPTYLEIEIEETVTPSCYSGPTRPVAAVVVMSHPKSVLVFNEVNERFCWVPRKATNYTYVLDEDTHDVLDVACWLLDRIGW